MTYPLDWPKCFFCDQPALDGHLTCGTLGCPEAQARAIRDARGTVLEQSEDLDGSILQTVRMPDGSEIARRLPQGTPWPTETR